MDHQLRDNYLGVMGVTTWYPRYLMPNAPEPDFGEMQVLDERDLADPTMSDNSIEALAVAPTSAADNVSSSAALGKLKGLMDPEAASKESQVVSSHQQDIVSPVKESLTVVAESDELSEVVPPFGFVFFRYELGVAVLVEVDAAYTLSSMETAFISNVLASIDIRSSFTFSHRVDWPLIKGNPNFQTRRFFVDSMQAVLSKQVSEVGVHSLILLGNHLKEHLVPVISDCLGSGVNVIGAPHIQSLMFSAEDKKQLWCSLETIKSNSSGGNS